MLFRLSWWHAVGLAALASAGIDDPPEVGWPQPIVQRRAPSGAPLSLVATAPAVDPIAQAVERQSVCIAARHWSAGDLASTLTYHYRVDGEYLYVGYFALWSEERPWGWGAMPLFGAPALAIDAVYSHFLFVFPGLQRVLYGRADIEGATVVYRRAGHRLEPLAAFADDGLHRPVQLTADDIVDGERVVLMTDTWSHQLGARDGAAFARDNPGAVECFAAERLRPLDDGVAAAFRLGSVNAPRRARPAWQLGPRGSAL